MRKRVFALLLCICMVVALFPFGAIAEGSKNVVNGVYADDVWSEGGNGTASYTAADGTKLTLSKTAEDKGNNTFDIGLKVVAESSKEITPPGAAATVLVIDVSNSMSWEDGCAGMYCWGTNTRMAAAKAAALGFIESYKGVVPFAGKYVAIVPFSDKAWVGLNWVDVSTYEGYCAAVYAINSLCASECIGTNLDDGLFNASCLLCSPAICCVARENRFVVALTDGASNYSRFNGCGMYGSYEINCDTAMTASMLRCCANVFTVCYGGCCDATYYGGPFIDAFLRDCVATPSCFGRTYAYSAYNVNELYKIFCDISKCIETEVGSSGAGAYVLDPLGEFVNLLAAPENFVPGEDGCKWVLEAVEPVVNFKCGTTTYVYTYTMNYTVTLDVDAEGFDEEVFHPANEPTALVWAEGESFEFPVPGLKGETSRFTVTYNQGLFGSLEGQDENGNVGFTGLKKWSDTPDAPAVIPVAGYSFTCWAPAVAEKVTGDALYVAQYAPNTDTPYSIEYMLEQADGSFVCADTVAKTGTTGETAFVAQEDVLSFAGYTFDKTVEGTVLEAEIKGDGSTVLRLFYTINSYDYSVEYYYDSVKDEAKTETGSAKYGTVIDSYTDKVITGYALTKTENFPMTVTDGENVIKVYYDKRTDYGYTVNYFINGTEIPAAPSAVVNNQTFGALVEETPIVIEGFTPVSCDPKSITIDVENNVITFYYYENVTLTANSAEFVYDGTEHSVSGFTGAPEGADFSAITVGASGTNAGTYPAAFAQGTVGTVDASGRYIVAAAVDGELRITAAAEQIVITANSAEKVYDGTVLTDAGYTFTDGILLEGDVLTAVVQGSISDAGTSVNKVTSYKVMRGDVDVTACYSFADCVDGVLKVTPAAVTITSGSASKQYDGKALTCDKVTAEGFVKGEGAAYTVTGSQTKVGSSKNTFTYVLNDNTKAGNYVITVVEGTLTVSPEEAPKTGDDGSALFAWLMLSSALAFAGITLLRKKERA